MHGDAERYGIVRYRPGWGKDKVGRRYGDVNHIGHHAHRGPVVALIHLNNLIVTVYDYIKVVDAVGNGPVGHHVLLRISSKRQRLAVDKSAAGFRRAVEKFDHEVLCGL